MIKIYSALITDFSQADYAKMYSLLDCALREKIDAKNKADDKMCSLAGLILLYRGARELYGKTNFDITFSEHGKPLCDFCHFNISHSENRVVCVFSDRKVGVDIQKIKPVVSREKYRFFNDRENSYINAQKDKIDKRYTELFTKKESAVKMLGLSLVDCGDIDTFSDDFEFETYEKDDFYITVCRQKNTIL